MTMRRRLELHPPQQQRTNRSDPMVKRRVSNAVMIDINAFCDEETAVVGTCLERLDTEIFQYEFEVAWFRGDTQLGKIAALNTPVVKTALRRFFVAARDAIKRFGFVGLYVVRDIDAWKERILRNIEAQEANDAVNEQHYLESDSDDDGDTGVASDDDAFSSADGENRRRRRRAGGKETTLERKSRTRFYETIAANLPFGVIPLGEGENECYGHYVRCEDRSTMTKTLMFEPNASWREAAMYDFRVIDKGVKFVSRTLYSGGGDGSGSTSGELIPVSPFIKIAKEHSLMEEAQTTTFDFNSMQVYRDEYAIAIPLADERVDNVEERILYGMDSILGAQQQPARERESWAMDNARDQLNRAQMQNALARPAGGDQQQVSLGMQRLMQFGRPRRADFLVPISKSVQIPTVTAHQPTYSPEQLRREYEHNVCALLGLPFAFFKPFANQNTHNGGGSDASSKKPGATGNGESRDFAQGELDQEVQRQHALFAELFSLVYRHTFQAMDDAALISLDFYKDMRASVAFDYVVRKSDRAVRELLPYHQARIISPVLIRRFLYQNMGIDDDPEIEPEFPQDEILAQQQQQQKHQATPKKRKREAAASGGGEKKKKRDKEEDT